MESGVLAGYNVVDVKVNLYDGSYHEVDSSEMAFKIAGSMAFKDAMAKADPVLTEPIMKVVVTTPEEYMGDVIGDINTRRGQINSMETDLAAHTRSTHSYRSPKCSVTATDSPFTILRDAVHYSMEPDHFAEVPKSIPPDKNCETCRQ